MCVRLYKVQGKDKVADASAVSIKPLYKIEDRPRSKQPDTANRIPRAAKERTRSAEDTVEVIDRSIE